MPSKEFSTAKERFDTKAATWDTNPVRAALGKAISERLSQLLETSPQKPDLFDYGCGTGTDVLPVANKCASVTGCDFSEGMLRQFETNAASIGLTNVSTTQRDLSTEALPMERYDLVHCAMVMHHIEDVPAMLARFKALLRPGGRLSLADLETEDGTFHEDNTGVAHFGFATQWIVAELEKLGLKDVQVKIIHTSERPRNGQMRGYPIFHATARLG